MILRRLMILQLCVVIGCVLNEENGHFEDESLMTEVICVMKRG